MKTRFIFLFIIMATVWTKGQTVAVDSVFEEYGRRKGSAMVSLGKDVLDGHTKIERYKCLIINFDQEIYTAVTDAVLRDFSNQKPDRTAAKIMEVKENGRYKNFYFVVKKNGSSHREYVLFKHNNKQITLIYMKGKIPESEYDDELKKLKELFVELKKK